MPVNFLYSSVYAPSLGQAAPGSGPAQPIGQCLEKAKETLVLRNDEACDARSADCQSGG